MVLCSVHVHVERAKAYGQVISTIRPQRVGGENGGEEGGCLDLGLRMPAYPWHTPTNNLQLEAGQEQRLPESMEQPDRAERSRCS